MMTRKVDPHFIDLEVLLAPLSDENPCGEWLRYEGTYDQVREARREDDATLPQGVWQSELKRADWEGVESLCATALARRSKDLQLAVWLMEAWIQLDGFVGAARGLELMIRLCELYWDQAYPPVENDLTARLAPIRWINDKLSRRMRLVPLTNPTVLGVPAYCLAHWEVAMRNPGGSSKSADVVTLAKFEQSASLTSYEWLCTLKDEVDAALIQSKVLDQFIDEHTGRESPGLMKFRAEIETAEQLVETMLAEARAKLPPPEPEPEPQPEMDLIDYQDTIPQSALMQARTENLPEVQTIPVPPSNGHIRSREDAYRMLEEIAEFLYRNDPHSPTPYLIRRAVAWGQMHFDELLPELVKSNAEVSDIMKLLKMEQPESKQ